MSDKYKDEEKKRGATEAPAPPIACKEKSKTVSGKKRTKEREATPPATSTCVKRPKKKEATPPVNNPKKTKANVDVEAERRKGEEAEKRLLKNTEVIDKNERQYKALNVKDPVADARNKFFYVVGSNDVQEYEEEVNVDLRVADVGDRTVTFRDKSGKTRSGPPTVEMHMARNERKEVDDKPIKVRFLKS